MTTSNCCERCGYGRPVRCLDTDCPCHTQPLPTKDWEKGYFKVFDHNVENYGVSDLRHNLHEFISQTLAQRDTEIVALLEGLKMDSYWVGQVFDQEDKTSYGETQMQSHNQALSDAITRIKERNV